MRSTFYAFTLSLLGLATSAFAQEARMAADAIRPQPGRQCATMEVLEAQMAADPSLAQRMAAVEAQTRKFQANPSANRSTAGTVVIPVVVHVLYNTAAQNVSTQLITDQLSVLNADFAKANADASLIPPAFSGVAANTNIQFVLAKRAPDGSSTTGILRKETKTRSWSANDAMKSSRRGGSDPWPTTQYLNIWVCNLGNGLLGYAQFPGGPVSTDGVVVLYSSLPGGSSSPYNKGRTATHEVGHWLNLRHIWGDASCGNDLVNDTPTQQTSNYGCPSFPRVTCTNGPNGDMFMNYMDYTDDACMYMFSAGQSTRMNALFGTGGQRASLLTSQGGTAPRQAASLASLATERAAIGIYPNPASQTLNVSVPAKQATALNVKVYDLRGYEMRQARYDGQGHVAVAGLPQGLYQVVISDGQQTIRQRFQKD